MGAGGSGVRYGASVVSKALVGLGALFVAQTLQLVASTTIASQLKAARRWP